MAYRAQPGPSTISNFPQPTAQMPAGRPSPLPPIPQVSSASLGQPGQTPPTSITAGTVNGDKGPDYVYFERKPSQFADQTTGKAMAAKMKLELYYKEAVEGVVGRKER